MSDIVKSLRARNEFVAQTAADEIETLRNDRDMMQDAVISRDMTIDALRAELSTLKQEQEPVAWIRFCSDGCYEGQIMNSKIEDVRKNSGAWTPLYAAPKPCLSHLSKSERQTGLILIDDTQTPKPGEPA